MRAPIALALLLAAAGCADVPVEDAPSSAAPAYVDHPEPSDLRPVPDGKADGTPARFDPAWIVSDAFFADAEAMDAAAVQAFFEATPYDHRSWLADAVLGGRTAAEALVDAARRHGVNPLLLLARMQVEKGLVSRQDAPRGHAVDFALGCGCPDGRDCYDGFRGLDRQLECAAETLRRHFDASAAGEGEWRAGAAGRTLDPRWVTPANHATAALYAYTPWVLPGRGGNWLVWNVTRRYETWLAERGLLRVPEGCSPDRDARPFVGSPCGCDADCGFAAGGAAGFCHPAGFCTLPCAGYCPDLDGRAPTFCVADPTVPGPVTEGICVSRAVPANGHCADVPGTLDLEAERFVGDSGAGERTAEVCVPAPQ